MQLTLGFNCKVFIDLTSDLDNPTWTEMGNVGDVSIDPAWSEVPSTIRANEGDETVEPGLRKTSIELQQLQDPTDPHFAFILAQSQVRGPIHLCFTDGGEPNVAGTLQLRLLVKVLGMSKPENLADGVYVTWTLRQCLGGPKAQVEIVD